MVAARPYCAATRRFNGGGERVDVLAILSASLRSGASPLNKGEEWVASRPYCEAIRRFNCGGEGVDWLAILSASLRSGASPLNKGEEWVASRPYCEAIRRFNGGGEGVDWLAIAVFEANGETKRREATTISPRKWRELSPWAKREARSRSLQPYA